MVSKLRVPTKFIRCRNVKALVGEVDFSFHAISTSQDSEEALLLGDQNKGKKD